MQRNCTWQPEHHEEVERNFHHLAKNRLPDMLHDEREKFNKFAAQGKDYRPGWIGENIWPKLLEYWRTDKRYKKRSNANKQNRNTGKGGNLHTGGCVSVGTHIRHLVCSYIRKFVNTCIYLIIRELLIINFFCVKLEKNIG
jgi:hypothetical protein